MHLKGVLVGYVDYVRRSEGGSNFRPGGGDYLHRFPIRARNHGGLESRLRLLHKHLIASQTLDLSLGRGRGRVYFYMCTWGVRYGTFEFKGNNNQLEGLVRLELHDIVTTREQRATF